MNSLRARLVLGFAFVALVPLLLALLLFSARIQDLVRVQAADRLNQTLSGAEARLRDEALRLDERLRTVSRDPELARLATGAAPGDTALTRRLGDIRFVLGLDFLEVRGAAGTWLADGSTVGPDSSVASAERPAPPFAATGRTFIPGARIATMPDGHGAALLSAVPIAAHGATIAVLRGGRWIRAADLTALHGGASGIELMLRDPQGRTIASTLDPEQERFAALMEDPEGAHLPRRWLSRRMAVEVGPAPRPILIGFASTAAADATISTLRLTALWLGLLGLAAAVVLGVLWSQQVSRPLDRLVTFSERVARGEWDESLEMRGLTELETLAAALDRMRNDLRAYRARLVVGERHAAWSQMARMVAHEVKNPLTPIAVSIADLKRSHDLGRAEFPRILDEAVRTIGEELTNLKQLLQEFSDFGRMPAPQFAPCRLADLIGDIRTLYHGEIAAQRLSIIADDGELSFEADRGQLRQALINLVKNALEAIPADGRVQVEFRVLPGTVEIAVIDTGPGMTEEERRHLFVPEYTTKREGSGLGLAIVERIVTEHDGTIDVESAPGHGSRFRIRLPIRRKDV